jgi:hypothetical protein
MRDSIVVAGALAQRPRHGGHTWVFLQYLLGFRRLGWDVLFLDRLEPAMCVDRDGRPASLRSSENLRYLEQVMERFGLADSWAVLYDRGREVVGLGRSEVLARARRSTLLLNVMGYLDDEEILGAVPLRVFLDIDPGFGQIWQETGLSRPFQGHDRYVTVGELVGLPGCSIPDCGIAWIPTKPAVELAEWPAENALVTPRRFTTVASWRGPFGPLEYDGKTYGLRVHEFRRFLDLPARTGAAFEVALDIDEADADDLQRLEAGGWDRVDPIAAAGDPWRYRDFVRHSWAEVMIAKNMYVATRSGWFSDRSACYLASGRPVLAQDTELEDLLPLGEGVVAFDTIEEAVEGVERIGADYKRHSRAAREIAQEHFAARRVLPRLLERLGAG